MKLRVAALIPDGFMPRARWEVCRDGWNDWAERRVSVTQATWRSKSLAITPSPTWAGWPPCRSSGAAADRRAPWPSNKTESFIKKEQIIYNAKVDKPSYQDILTSSGSTDGKIKVQYKVKAGDYLHKIAIAYSCTVDDLLVWNPSADENLSTGELLSIWVDKKTYQKIQTLKTDSLNVRIDQ